MVTSVIPVSNIINVTVAQTPSGLTERNANVVALFTTESPSNNNDFDIFISASQVEEIYGTNSVTTQMANAVFSQTPNLRSGAGNLVIIPLENATSATQGTFTTSDISLNVPNFQPVIDGEFTATVNGEAFDVTGLNFENGTSLDGIAQIIQNKLPAAQVSVEGNTIVFTSRKVGADSDVVLSSLGGAGTDITTAGFLDIAAATAATGADATGESVQEAIARIDDQVFFAGVMTSLQMQDDAIFSLAQAIEAQNRIFVHQGSSTQDILGIGATLDSAGLRQTKLLVLIGTPEDANIAKAAYVGRAFSVNFFGVNTSQTLNLKPLAGVLPDQFMTQTLYNQAAGVGVDLYVSIDGVESIISNGAGGMDFFDNVYNDLALQFALEAAGFNYLRQTNTKVPQTEQGMNGLKGAYRRVLTRFVTVGAVAAGTWTSSETFGDPEIFRNNVSNNGFYIFSIPIGQQPATQREQRIAPLVQIAVKRAGAIHSSDVLVIVND